MIAPDLSLNESLQNSQIARIYFTKNHNFNVDHFLLFQDYPKKIELLQGL